MSIREETFGTVSMIHPWSAPLPKRRPKRGALLGGLALAACCLLPGVYAAPTLYPQADPTGAEQYLLIKLNHARMDPAGEGQRPTAWLRNDSFGKIIASQYTINPDQVASDFAALPVVPPLVFDPHLLAAARAHSADLAAHNGLGPGAATLADNSKLGPDGSTPIGHLGWDGSNDISRVQASGFQGDGTGENVASGCPTLDSIHAGYLIDWATPDSAPARSR